MIYVASKKNPIFFKTVTGKYLENWGIIIKEILKAKPYYIYAPLGRIDHIHREPNCFFDRYRFFLLILCTLCLSSVFSNMITLNFTIICMTPQNGTSKYDHPVYNYTSFEKTILQWTVAITSMLATLPMSWICTHYGARWPFLISGVVSAICTGLIPPAAKVGIVWFSIVRAFQGIAYACDFAVVGVLCTRWAPLLENAKFLGVLTSFAPISSFLTNFFAGNICESSFGWPWVHYSHAIVGLILFFGWYAFYTDEPHINSFVSSHELGIIHENKTESHKHHEPFVPYLEIIKDKVIWAVWMNSFADLFSGFFLYIYGPTYFKFVLHLSTTQTGYFGAVGAISHVPVKMICGYISDSYHCISERHKMWFFNTVAVAGPAFIFLYFSLFPLVYPMITAALFGGVHALLGFNCGGFYKCGSLSARQYGEFVIAFTQFIKCVVFFIAPLLVTVFVSDESNAADWNIIFYFLAVWLISANILFCVYATDKPCEFTKITKFGRVESIKK